MEILLVYKKIKDENKIKIGFIRKGKIDDMITDWKKLFLKIAKFKHLNVFEYYQLTGEKGGPRWFCYLAEHDVVLIDIINSLNRNSIYDNWQRI